MWLEINRQMGNLVKQQKSKETVIPKVEGIGLFDRGYKGPKTLLGGFSEKGTLGPTPFSPKTRDANAVWDVLDNIFSQPDTIEGNPRLGLAATMPASFSASMSRRTARA